MSDGKVTNGRATAADVAEHQIAPALSGGSSISIKALATNVGLVFIGTVGNSSAALGYPLSKGETINLDIKNGLQLFYTLENANDKLAWLVTGP